MEKRIYDIDYYDYSLPNELISQVPLEKRDESRLMVLDKKSGLYTHKIFKDIVDYLDENDVLVLNNTKVLPARIFGSKVDTNAKIELLLLKELNKDTWECLVKHQKRLKVGVVINFNDILFGEVIELKNDGITIIKFSYEGVFLELLDKIGIMPLPPYIKEKLKNNSDYQTVYASVTGSAAAPTAGLHFTNELLDKIRRKGIKVLYITLHVGIGTFRPVNVSDIRHHEMHSEYYEISSDVASELNKAKKEGNKIIAVGTTSLRTLESNFSKYNEFKSTKEETDIFIYPPYKIKSVDALITNFHLPKSTLLMLVSSLTSRNNIMKAYNEAIKQKYKFFSFGDAMFITDLKIKNNLKIHKELLKGIRGEVIENFEILKGNNNILISAPHAYTHIRNGKPKKNEYNTANIAKLLNHYTGAHAIYLTSKSENDANYDEVSTYKTKLIKYIKDNDIKYFLDIHGIEKTSKYDIVLGTNYYKNISEELVSKITNILKENFLNNVAVDKVYVAGEKTLASSVKNSTGITTIQIEINKENRKMKRKPRRFNKTLEALISVINEIRM